MDDCKLSFAAGRLRVDFFRRGKLVETRALDVAAVEKLAETLEELDKHPGSQSGSQSGSDGGIVLDRTHARSVSRQLRTLAFVLRVAGELWAAPEAAPPIRRRAADAAAPAAKGPSLDGPARRIRIAATKRTT
jgi:hypothetical protein